MKNEKFKVGNLVEHNPSSWKHLGIVVDTQASTSHQLRSVGAYAGANAQNMLTFAGQAERHTGYIKDSEITTTN